jgi:hypothetical protein
MLPSSIALMASLIRDCINNLQNGCDEAEMFSSACGRQRLLLSRQVMDCNARANTSFYFGKYKKWIKIRQLIQYEKERKGG